MKKIDDLMHTLDVRVDKWTAGGSFFQRHFLVFSISLMSALFILVLFKTYSSRSEVMAGTMKDDLIKIEQCLERIDKDCNILSIRAERAFIDFLTVEKFTGSMVGCLNLAHPAKWKGPYLRQNPTIQDRPYEIIKAKEGFFLVPSQGVKLPNGLIVGKDVVFTRGSQVLPMLTSGGLLNHKGQALGLRLKFVVGDWDASINQDTYQKISDVLKEFGDALPYAQREQIQDGLEC